MEIKDYKCKCGHNDFFFADKGSQKGIYCSYCGKWFKWADKDEQNLAMKQAPTTKNDVPNNNVGEINPITETCKTCRDYGSHHEVCDYCYKCSLWTEKEPSSSGKPNKSTTETLVSLGVYKQVAWERDIAIQQLHELGYEFGQKIEPTTKNDLGVEQYRNRMIEAFHNADCESLIALVVQPTEKEFEHLEWLLKTHYKTPQEPFINKPCVSEKVCEYDKQMVLDKIRAEIGNINLNEVATKYEDRFYGFQREVIKIIDKYKAEIEDKE